jgi:hypothetical protein
MALSELQQVNAIIGLSKNLPSWPSTLADHMYSLDRIELKFKIRDPRKPGHSIIINPDLLFVSDERNSSLIVELKSGSFHKHDLLQVDNLVKLKAIELIRDGAVTLKHTSPALVKSHKISIMMVVNEDHLATFLFEFKLTSHKASLVSIDRILIQSKHGDLTDNRLDHEFKNGISIEKGFIPTKFIRVLPTTNDTYEVIKYIVETVKELWVNNERSVTYQRIATKLFDGIWELFDSDAREQFINLVKKTLKEMRQTEFNRYLAPVPGKPDEWRLLRLPETEGKNRTTAQKTFSKITEEYKRRKLHGAEYKGSKYIDYPTFEDITEGFYPDNEHEEET